MAYGYLYGSAARAQGRLLSAIISSSHPLRSLLVGMMFFGVYLFFPGRHSPTFNPRALIFVFFPLVVMIFSWFYVRFVAKGFRVLSREIPKTSLENEKIQVVLEVKYDCPIPFSFAYMKESFPATDILESPELILQYKDFSKTGLAKIAYFNFLNRGYGDFTIGPVEITVQDPIGFFEKKLNFMVKSKIKVWLNPPTPEEIDLVKENALTPMGDSRSTLSGHGMDFYGIKEYVCGDDIRAMSWLKTAQAGKPVIKLFERDSRPDVLVVMHTDKSQVRGFGFGNTMKRLLRLGAAIIVEAQSEGLPVATALNIDDEPNYLKINSAVPVYGFMTELLATLQPASEGGLDGLVNVAMRKAGPGSIVFFLCQSVHVDIDTLLGALLNLRARGAKVCLWVIDDSSMLRFSEKQQNVVTRDEFKARMAEMDLDFLLIPAKKEKTTSL